MVLPSILLSLMVVGVPGTFLVSPDTHFTQCGGVFDTDKNVRGITEMNKLEATAYPNNAGEFHYYHTANLS